MTEMGGLPEIYRQIHSRPGGVWIHELRGALKVTHQPSLGYSPGLLPAFGAPSTFRTIFTLLPPPTS